ncbi:MAG: hypothetical protein AAF098_04670 [Pseudomonadota bacterium]
MPRLILAGLLINTHRHDLARRHVDKALKHPEIDWASAVLLGNALFKLGDFNRSRSVLMSCLENGQMDFESLMNLAAVSQRAGKEQLATRCMRSAGWLRPLGKPPKVDSGKPNLLVLRSLGGNRLGIKKPGQRPHYSYKFKVGHFSTELMLAGADANLYSGSAAGGNLNTIDELPEITLVLNTIACADSMAPALEEIDSFLVERGLTSVVNPPSKVLLSSRDANSERLGDIPNVVFPRTLRLHRGSEPSKEFAAKLRAQDLDLPLILRQSNTHTGRSVKLLTTEAELLEYLDATPPGTDLYAIEYIDCKRDQPYYRKIRCFFIDGKFYPVACLSHDTWQIHSGDRYQVMDKVEATRNQEQAYLENPERFLGESVFTALHRIAKEIDLDFFGIDFAPDDQGRAVVFEANAAMRHNYDHAVTFPYTRPHLDRVSEAMQNMIRTRLVG